MRKTKKAYTEYLSNYYSDFALQQAKDALIYLTSKNRVKYTTESKLTKAWSNFTLGEIIRKYDPIAFNVGFNEWRPK